MILKVIRVRLNTDTYTEDNEGMPLEDFRLSSGETIEKVEASVKYAIGRWMGIRPEEVVINRIIVVPGREVHFEGETKNGFRKWEVDCQRISSVAVLT